MLLRRDAKLGSEIGDAVDDVVDDGMNEVKKAEVVRGFGIHFSCHSLHQRTRIHLDDLLLPDFAFPNATMGLWRPEWAT